jgi:hypothetical protein
VPPSVLLQPQYRGGVLLEEGSPADVAAQAGEGAVAGLLGDGPLRGAGLGGGGGETGPQRMTGEVGDLEPGEAG